MLKLLRQYPSSISTGALALAGAGSCALIRILDLRDSWRNTQPKKDLQNKFERQVEEIRTDAFERRRNWNFSEPVILTDREDPDAITDYARKIPNPPQNLIEEMERTRQELKDFKLPTLERRDLRWAQRLLAVGLVCFAGGLTRDLKPGLPPIPPSRRSYFA